MGQDLQFIYGVLPIRRMRLEYLDVFSSMLQIISIELNHSKDLRDRRFESMFRSL